MSKYQIREVYNDNSLKIVRYTHKNGVETYRAFYKGNPEDLPKVLIKYQEKITKAFYKTHGKEPNRSLESYLEENDNIVYVDNLGTPNNGIILGAYVPSNDKIYVLRNIPQALVDAINYIRQNQLENILGKESYNHKKRIAKEDIKKFAKAHERAHKRRQYANESQNEKEVDLEAAVLTGIYPIIRFPEILKEMYDPRIRQEILNKPGIEYIRNAA